MSKAQKYLDWYEGKCKRTFHGIISIAVALILILCAFLVSCKTPQLPTLPNSSDRSHDSVRTELRIDTIYQDRWHKEYQKGDTLYIHDSIDRWRVREVYIHDSIDNSRCDTIINTVEVEKPYKEFLVRSGVAFWILLVFVIVCIGAGITLKIKRGYVF